MTWKKNPLQNTWAHLFIPMMVIQTPLQTNAHRCRYNTHQLTLHDLNRKRFVEETVVTFSEKDVNKPWPFSFSGSFSEQGQRKPDQFRTFPSEVTTISLFPLICWVQNIVSSNCLIRVISGGRRDLKNGGKLRGRFPCSDDESYMSGQSEPSNKTCRGKIRNSHSSVTRVTVEEKSNFKCITSGKLAFLSFDLPPILVEGLCMHGLIQKYFLHNWYFLRYY